MGNIRETRYFQAVQDKKTEVNDVPEQVYIVLAKKGYSPVDQIVGYIMSGNPTYITNHKSARNPTMRVERDEILEEPMTVYIDARLRQTGVFHCICCWQVGVRMSCEFHVPEQDFGNLVTDSVSVPCLARDHSATVIAPQQGVRRPGNEPP